LSPFTVIILIPLLLLLTATFCKILEGYDMRFVVAIVYPYIHENCCKLLLTACEGSFRQRVGQ